MNEKTGAIFVDVIGCLLSINANVSSEYYEGAYYLSQRVQEANVRRFPPIVLCSGRNRTYIEITAFFIGLPDNYSIIEHGVIFFNPRTKQMILHPNLTSKIITKFKKAVNPKIQEILKEHPGLFLSQGNEICFSIERERETKCISLREVYKRIRRELVPINRRGRIAEIILSDYALDIVPFGINRESAIELLANVEQIDLKKSLGIGSSKQDIPFLKKVGVVGCVSNSDEACKRFIKARKGRISHKSYAAGVADVIDYYQQRIQRG